MSRPKEANDMSINTSKLSAEELELQINALRAELKSITDASKQREWNTMFLKKKKRKNSRN